MTVPTTLWNPLADLKEKIKGQGGFVNAHGHFDRAFSVSQADFLGTQTNNKGSLNTGPGLVNVHLHEKWKLVDKFKSEASEEIYFSHIAAALRSQRDQGVQACLSFIDCDPVAGERAITAAKRAREYAAKELKMRFVLCCQTLKGVVQPEVRTWFEKALESVDVIGGLPGADKGHEQEHIDILLKAGKETKKRVHIHVDQLNSAEEKETELLAKRVVHWGMEGQVSAVHGISIGAHPKKYRDELYRLCRDAGLSFVACPSAWIDSRRSEVLSPTHNAITPLDEMIPAGITVAIGSDNIADLYKPFCDGDMMTELRILLESTHFYEVDDLVKVATINGLKVLGLA